MYVFDLEVINDIYEEESIDVVFEGDVDHQDDRNYVPEEIEIKAGGDDDILSNESLKRASLKTKAVVVPDIVKTETLEL